MKKIVCLILVFSMLMFALIGCRQETDTSANASADEKVSADSSDSTNKECTSSKPLNVACIVFSSGIPVLYANDMGWFEEAGLNVNLEVFANGALVNEAIAAKEIDIAVSGFASVYALAASDCTWLADVNNNNSITIFARPESDIVAATGYALDSSIIGSAETIRGSKVVCNLGTSSQYNVDTYLNQFGLTESDVEMIQMDFSTGYQAFIAGEGDLIATSNPYSADLAAAGYVNVGTLTATSGVELMDGCFARNKVLDERAGDVKIFLQVLLRAMDALQDEDVRFDYSLNKFAEIGNAYTETGLRNEFEVVDYVGTDYISQDDYVLGSAWAPISEWLFSIGKITADNLPNVEKSINGSLLREASGLDIN